MTSFGKTILHYMVTLKPALEARGFEVAVFHATGMGGRAFESLASEGAFACVMDFATQEVGNHLMGGLSAGADRLTNAGASATPQIVAPACYDLVDMVGWKPLPERMSHKPAHDHNRLLKSVVLDAEERREVARTHAEKLATAKGKSVFIMPKGGCNEWDRPGADLHDAEGLAAFVDEIEASLPDNVTYVPLEAHINDAAFCDTVLEVFDGWVADGTIKTT